MGAVFAGIVRAPMTSVLMIFEMTQDYAVIVPLMIANLVSLFISSRLQRQPIYEALAKQDASTCRRQKGPSNMANGEWSECGGRRTSHCRQIFRFKRPCSASARANPELG